MHPEHDLLIYDDAYWQGLAWFSEGTNDEIINMMREAGPDSSYTRAGRDILAKRGLYVHPVLIKKGVKSV